MRPWVESAMMHERLFTLGVAIVIGVLCGFAAVLFKHLVHGLQILFWGEAEIALVALQALSPWRLLLMPALGGLLVGPIVYFFAREARGSGVPEVMAAVAVQQGILRARIIFAKAAASALTIASGGSAGREGPIIQIGAAIGSGVGQILRVSRHKLRTFVGCGAAAGIAATFNAPIAGALFSVEVILGEFGVAQFSPIVISAVLATVIARHHFGDSPVFVLPEYEMASTLELGAYLLLGLLCGLASFLFIKLLYRMEDGFETLKRVHPALKPMLGGLALGCMAMWLPHLFGDGYETVNLALRNELPFRLMILLLACKMLATSLTLGSGGSGGVFAPSLFLGAMLGGALGQLVATHFGHQPQHAGGYALVAMGGLVAGATHAPISAILIIFEITNDYTLILPLMLVCIVSTAVAQTLNRESVYTMKLVRRGIDLVAGRSMNVLKAYTVQQTIKRDVPVFHPDTPVHALVEAMIETDHSQFYIVRQDQALAGIVSAGDLRRVLLHRETMEQALLVEDILHEQTPVCTPDETLSAALIRFEKSGFTELPVVSDLRTRTFLGVLHYNDVFALYNEAMLRLDTADGLAERFLSAESVRRVPLFRGFSVIEWAPPSDLWDLTLAQAELPARYGVRVILVKKKSNTPAGGEEMVPVVPGHDYLITRDDTFLIYGEDEALDQVQKF